MRIIGSPRGDRNRKIASWGTFSGNIATPTVQNLCATVEDCPDLPRPWRIQFFGCQNVHLKRHKDPTEN
jgi:hypothetical protein